MAVHMKAFRTFQGIEGNVRSGDIFEVENADRANQLEEMKLAGRASGEVTNLQQVNAGLDEMKKEDLEKTAEKEGATYRRGATVPEIKKAIVAKREAEHIKAQAAETAKARKHGTESGEAKKENE